MEAGKGFSQRCHLSGFFCTIKCHVDHGAAGNAQLLSFECVKATCELRLTGGSSVTCLFGANAPGRGGISWNFTLLQSCTRSYLSSGYRVPVTTRDPGNAAAKTRVQSGGLEPFGGVLPRRLRCRDGKEGSGARAAARAVRGPREPPGRSQEGKGCWRI